MKHALMTIGLIVVSLSLVGVTVVSAQSSEQVVFRGTGAGSFQKTSTAFSFSIWCEAASSNSYATECNGSMSFNSLGITKAVGDTAPIRELAEGQYQMTVGSVDGSVACSLTNVLPLTGGSTNTVNVQCTSPKGSGQSTNAVVQVTGPS